MPAAHSPTCTIQAAADLLNIHSSTVEKLIHDGNLPAGKVGRAYVILTQHVLEYAEKVILKQTAERLIELKGPTTKENRRGLTRASSRSASTSRSSYAR